MACWADRQKGRVAWLGFEVYSCCRAGAFTGGTGGANGQVSTVRIMDPVPAKGNVPEYPNGYVKYENDFGQGVDLITGQTLSKVQAHFPL